MFELAIYAIIVILWTVFLFFQAEKKLNIRIIATILALAAVLFAISVVLSTDWNTATDSDKYFAGFLILTSISLFLLSCHIYFDGLRLDEVRRQHIA